ncbi:S-layer homology domain-containing protein [Sporosarcina sp. YIM B06819]|uniref:S-layer homology domain-containing protein n=1 Tax=Sporosarcina sp. YIM B06819 TaxID=3081769 RepID=UPI00298D4FD2|nr:S-layer homology domain-containing protein [Sporosarcina sp. YIM B06819]
MLRNRKIKGPFKIGLAALALSLFGFGILNVKANPMNQSFTDVHNEFWAKDEVTQLVDLGIINGYPDKQFRPGLEVSRAQAANLMANALALPYSSYKPIFKDVSAKSSHAKGAIATYEAGIFLGKEDGTFGVGDSLTREQMATVIVRAFNLQDTGEDIRFTDEDRISESHKFGVKVLAQHGITTGKEDGTFDPKTPVNRATYVVFLHRAMVQNKLIEKLPTTVFSEPQTYGSYEPIRHEQQFVEVPVSSSNKTYLRSNYVLQFAGEKVIPHSHAKDIAYTYQVVGFSPAAVTVTKRELPNGDYFLFTELRNPGRMPITIDVVQTETGLAKGVLHEFSRFPIKKVVDDTFGFDTTTYPTGIFEKIAVEGKVTQDMIGKSYRSMELYQKYPTGAESHTRELLEESQSFSGVMLGETQLSIYRLQSRGFDVVDQWILASEERLFEDRKQMDAWMLESAVNYKKRNKWYTAQGPYNKMATTVEPMPKSGRGYGRNLLLVKEDRVMALYSQTNQRYYESLLYNSFANLDIFRGKATYWETEVTSTYLKSLYGMTAPFVDTRFNEQIALFLYNSGKVFNHTDYNVGLKNYANLLVSQKEKGNIVQVDSESYYISDYFPLAQKVKTHTSMNHLLGGMNILLKAYQEFNDPVYLNTAISIQTAIEKDKAKWIRPDGDIWYKISPEYQFIGRDYIHLTLEDLINSYEMWSQIDPARLPIFEEMIRSKAGYLNQNALGYTTKIKNGLERIDMLELLPAGSEHTDAL